MAEVAFAAIIIEPRVDRAALLAANPIVNADEGGELRLTVQPPKPPDATVKGVQTSDASEAGSNKEIAVVVELPFSDAYIVAEELVEKSPAVAVNATDEEPAGTVRRFWETVRLGLLLDRAIEAVGPAGTALLKLTVQVVDARATRKPFTQVTELGIMAADNERGAIPTEPLRDAMTVTFWFELTTPTLAEKLDEVACAGITTEDGIVRMFATEVEMETWDPPEGAALDNVTVQTVLVFEGREDGAHCNDDTRETVANAMVALAVEPFSEATTVAL